MTAAAAPLTSFPSRTSSRRTEGEILKTTLPPVRGCTEKLKCLPTTVLLQPGERRRPRAAFGHHPKDFQLQQKPVTADPAHGDGVHEEKGAGE